MGVAAGEVTAAPIAPAWSPPAEIAVANDALTEPIAIADVSGAVNLFFADGPPARGPTTLLRYRRLAQGRWSEPATLLASVDNAELLNPALALDERGWLHAVYCGRTPATRIPATASPTRGTSVAMASSTTRRRSHPSTHTHRPPPSRFACSNWRPTP